MLSQWCHALRGMVNLQPLLFGTLPYVVHIIYCYPIKRMRLITRFYGISSSPCYQAIWSLHTIFSPAHLQNMPMPLTLSRDNKDQWSDTRTCLATSLTKATPGSNVANTTDPYLRTAGTGLIRIVTSVITPKVPGGRKQQQNYGRSIQHSLNTWLNTSL